MVVMVVVVVFDRQRMTYFRGPILQGKQIQVSSWAKRRHTRRTVLRGSGEHKVKAADDTVAELFWSFDLGRIPRDKPSASTPPA